HAGPNEAPGQRVEPEASVRLTRPPLPPLTKGGRRSTVTNFLQRIIADRDPERGDLLQPPPAARHDFFLRLHILAIEPALVERAVGSDRPKTLVDDELRLHRVAADVTFGPREQRPRIDQPQNETQVEVAVNDLRDRFAAHF